jgi:hypothetical protein
VQVFQPAVRPAERGVERSDRALRERVQVFAPLLGLRALASSGGSAGLS